MPAADHAQRVLSSLNQQRAVGRFCDAVLNVGDGVVYVAHRNILACFSELFQQSNMPTAPSTEFCLRECPNDGLELLLNFVYTGELKLDPDNINKVQHAATSLCVPEALALCQRFNEKSSEAVPCKRKRGRPRKTKADIDTPCSATDKNLPTVTEEESSFDTVTDNFSTVTTTTTRSGRVVKGPRRLVTDESADADLTVTENTSKTAAATVKAGSDVENPKPDQPTGETEVEKINVIQPINRTACARISSSNT